MPGLTFLFDLDGTMVDTDPLHIAAWNEVMASRGRVIDLEYYRTHIMGFPNDSITEGLAPDADPATRAAMGDAKETIFRRLVGSLHPTPGLLDLLDWIDAQGLPKAVVTNAPRANAMLLLQGLGLRERFPVVVIGEELERGKPDPLPYLVGLRELGAAAERAVAFEDSLSGVRAAVAAGIPTVGVLSALSTEQLLATGARMAVRDFTDPSLLAHLRDRARV